MNADDVVVTGLGLVTPAGVGVDAAWSRLLSGRPTASTDPGLAGLPVDFSCRVPGFDAAGLVGRRTAWRLDRFAWFAVVAAREAMADARLSADEWDPLRVAVVIGTGANSMERYEAEFAKMLDGRPADVSGLAIPRSVPNMAAGEVGSDLGARGPGFTVCAACASGTTALGLARDLLRAGSCDIALAGGAESIANRVGSVCFGQMRILSRRAHDPSGASRPFDRDRDGFVLGEGAGVLVLERAAHARARGVAPRARLAGFGASCDAHHFAAPHPDGRGAADAIRVALADAGLGPADIDHVNAHGTSTVLNDTTEAKALWSALGTPPPVTASKSVLGHAVGGAGAIEAVATVLSLQHQTIPPTANLDTLDPGIDLDVVHKSPRRHRMRAALSDSLGFGGQNAALVFTTP